MRISAVASGALWLNATSLSAKNNVVQRKDYSVLDLNGVWQVAETGKDNWIPAKTPGCVHTDLMAAGKIQDPYFGDNENAIQWIGKTEWTYRRRFQVSAEILKRDRVVLKCEGLDTLATLRINGQTLGKTDNMFRVWEFDVKSVLRKGTNVLVIDFASPFPVMESKNKERALYEWIGPHEPKGRAWVRKEPCSFGWDWGPVLPSCGIWRSISIHSFSFGRLADFLVLQEHLSGGKVRLDVEVNAEVVRAGEYEAAITVQHNGKAVGTVNVPITATAGKAKASIDIPDAKPSSGGLWAWGSNRCMK